MGYKMNMASPRILIASMMIAFSGFYAVACVPDEEFIENPTAELPSQEPDDDDSLSDDVTDTVSGDCLEDNETNDAISGALEINPEANIEACVNRTGDRDYFTISIPAENDSVGGIVTFKLTPPSDIQITLEILDEMNSSLGLFQTSAPGEIINAWLAAGNDTEYYFAISDMTNASSEKSYDLQLAYSPVTDTYEPNDSLGEATTIGLDTLAQAYLFAGANALATADIFNDYYRFSAVDGEVTILAYNLPAGLSCIIELLDSDENILAATTSSDGTITMQADITAGDYYTRIGVTAPPELTGLGTTLPVFGAAAYSFEIFQ
jgi:hypothetical protein